MKPFKFVPISLICLLWMIPAADSLCQDRFPKPEFETDYQQPLTATPEPRSELMGIVDVTLLAIALGLAGYFALKKRSRKHLFVLMLVSVLYFGFMRRGCVCPVGSLQNIALALFDGSYILPWTVAIFFFLPLIFTLFFGRIFCAAVCPLGGVQDLLMLKPARLPSWLIRTLSMLPILYLGFAVLFAATGASFLICRFDPFVPIFRFSGRFGIVLMTAFFVILSIFIARPYCSFLCPYGVLLGWMSRLSRRHLTITPDNCIQCRLCEDVCPFDAIEKPSPERAPENRGQGVRRLGIMLIIAPILILTGGWSLSRLDASLARVHPVVRLAERIHLEDTGVFQETTLESRTFRSTGTPIQELYDRATYIRNRFHTGGWMLGIFLGLVFTWKLMGLSVRRIREDYAPDRFSCYSCGRCLAYCPVGKDIETQTKEDG